MSFDTSLKTIHVRMFEHGHSFDDIRKMNLEDLGTVLAVWREKSLIEKKKARRAASRKGKKSLRG